MTEHYHKITPRSVVINFSKTPPIDWYNGELFASHWFDALSTVLPQGEELFIDSVKAIRAEILDNLIKEQVSNFIKQEAFHAREHRKYNRILKARGYDIDKMDKGIDKGSKRLRSVLSVKMQLGITIAFEHITAILSAAVLRGDLMTNADKNMKAMWHWHAAEEIEHKCVAWDVYKHIGGGYLTRIFAMTIAMITMGIRVTSRIVHMIRKDGKLNDFKEWRKGFSFLFSRKGVIALLFKDFCQFYKPSFHPSQQDTFQLAAEWIMAYEKQSN